MSKRSRKKVAKRRNKADQKSIDNWTARSQRLHQMSNARVKVSKNVVH